MQPNVTPSDAILANIKRRLIEGATSRKSAMHTPVVATADGDLRVMVLRDYDPTTRMMRFHTDARSPKVAALAAYPTVSLLCYDPDAKVQIRMRGHGRIERAGEIADAAWAASTTFARRCYLTIGAPGALSPVAASGLPEWAEGIQPTEEQVAPGRDNFAVLLVTIDRFDWLYLSNDGHQRAQIEFTPDGDCSAQWVLP